MVRAAAGAMGAVPAIAKAIVVSVAPAWALKAQSAMVIMAMAITAMRVIAATISVVADNRSAHRKVSPSSGSQANRSGKDKGRAQEDSHNVSSGAAMWRAAVAGGRRGRSNVRRSYVKLRYPLFFSPPSASTRSASIAANSPVISANSMSNCSSASSA